MPKATERDIQEALELVEKGEGLNRVARDFGIPPSTLSRRRHGAQPPKQAHESAQTLSKLQEDEIQEWILLEELCGRTPTKAIVRSFAQEIATGLRTDGNGIIIGKKWVDKFLQRHKRLGTKVGHVADADRGGELNKHSIEQFYQHITRVRTAFNIEAEDIYNMDETEVQEAEAEAEDVADIYTSKSHRNNGAKPPATGWMTTMHYISALGRHGTIAYIFKSVNMQAQWFPADIEESEYAATKRGWSNHQIAVAWLETIFGLETKPREKPHGPKSWRMLILDGHNTHLSAKFMLKAFRMRIALVYLPAHSSEAIQPLDKSCFSVLKWNYHQQMVKYRGMKATGPIQKQRMLEAYHIASEYAFTAHIIRQGWRSSGIWPLDPGMVLNDPELFRPGPKPSPRTPPDDLETPLSSRQVRDQTRVLKRKYPHLPNEVFSTLYKAARAIDEMTLSLTILRRQNYRTNLKLGEYGLD